MQLNVISNNLANVNT
ncbi:MAG: flagellar basal body protein, partial [Desulfobulbaceae bacterium]|nr:flagellar basal body protein [Desulfobulbaceae bacterium]